MLLYSKIESRVWRSWTAVQRYWTVSSIQHLFVYSAQALNNASQSEAMRMHPWKDINMQINVEYNIFIYTAAYLFTYILFEKQWQWQGLFWTPDTQEILQYFEIYFKMSSLILPLKVLCCKKYDELSCYSRTYERRSNSSSCLQLSTVLPRILWG